MTVQKKGNILEDLKNGGWLMVVNILLLLLFSVRYLNFPNGITIAWGAVLGIYSFQKYNKKIVDGKSLFLLMGMAAHALAFWYYNEDYSVINMIELAITPFFTYIIGKALLSRKEINCIKYAKIAVLTFCLGISLHATLNYFEYLKYGFTIPSGKRWCDAWIEVPLFATEHSFFAVAMAGLLFYGIWEIFHWRLDGILILLGVVWANYINIKVANRMVFAVTGVIFIFNVALYIFLNFNNKGKMRRIFYIVGSILLAALIFWITDPFNIKESAYFDALLHRDGGIVQNVRFQIHFRALKQIIPNWLGGGTMELGFDNAHNFWLQVANMSGIVPFVLLVIYTVWNLVDMCKLICMKHVDETIKYLAPSVFLALMCYLLMEQGGHGSPDYFMYFTLVGGMISQSLICASEEEARGK